MHTDEADQEFSKWNDKYSMFVDYVQPEDYIEYISWPQE